MRTFGPENGTLTVRTKRTGAASKAGHDLLIEVTSWSATLDPDADPVLTLTADSRSLRVVEGTGGVQALDADDKAGIEQTIDEEVLKGTAIEFRSTAVEGRRVEGELELAGQRHPISFQLTGDEDGRLTGSATVKQTDWGMKPYSALFGTLKVADEIEVAFEKR
jgi:YceI-like domain